MSSIVWQALGTLPDSLEKGSLAGLSERVLVRTQTGRPGVSCGRVVLVLPLRISTPDPFGTHTPSVASLLPKREVTDPLHQGFGHSGGQFGALRAFIVRMRLSLPPAAGLLVGP